MEALENVSFSPLLSNGLVSHLMPIICHLLLNLTRENRERRTRNF